MDLDDIKAQLDRIFAAGHRPASRDQAQSLRQALVDYKVAIAGMRESLARSERDLDTARRETVDYARRRDLAAGISDQDTVQIADEYLARARERTDLLERKVIVQRDELALAEREYEATRQRFQSASRGIDPAEPTQDTGSPDQALFDQRAREAAVEAQLAHLKKKLGETK